ncbi:hypothetical protein HYPSUDRAFT_209163 [Hypholoma sublateritium FD-334 SS-4]|uniref:Uncharacterized protein n=1 Tax=Hypholoma sublateritium (strain FD-334 SS-4) TaxID=945553 RepID=A0A0D2N3Q8_HYPSF|nr:hypothetical protein HYPSUDRAFT_209163 [Hypholoma sublateritium FD-334 SS-4]
MIWVSWEIFARDAAAAKREDGRVVWFPPIPNKDIAPGRADVLSTTDVVWHVQRDASFVTRWRAPQRKISAKVSSSSSIRLPARTSAPQRTAPPIRNPTLNHGPRDDDAHDHSVIADPTLNSTKDWAASISVSFDFPGCPYGFCGTSFLILSRGKRRFVTTQPSSPFQPAESYSLEPCTTFLEILRPGPWTPPRIVLAECATDEHCDSHIRRRQRRDLPPAQRRAADVDSIHRRFAESMFRFRKTRAAAHPIDWDMSLCQRQPPASFVGTSNSENLPTVFEGAAHCSIAIREATSAYPAIFVLRKGLSGRRIVAASHS